MLVPLAPVPQVDPDDSDQARVDYARYRTELSRHRTEVAEHRTDLSEFRSDLSEFRTDLAIQRNAMAAERTEMAGRRTELAMRQAGMSFHRTRMGADRTLMAVIRTSLALIGFGFTIYQAFSRLYEAGVLHRAAAPRNFGLSLVVLGVFLLVGGIVGHVRFALELRGRRRDMAEEGLVHGQSRYPVSITLLTAIALFFLGLAAIASIVFKTPPFH